MNINEASKQTGLSKDILRFYEKKGIVKPKRNVENKYRDYTDHDVFMVVMARKYNVLGIDLSTLQEMFYKQDLAIGSGKLQDTLIKLEQEQKWLDQKIANAHNLLSIFNDVENNVKYRIIEPVNLYYYRKYDDNGDENYGYNEIITHPSAPTLIFRHPYNVKDTKDGDVGILSYAMLDDVKVKPITYNNVTIFRTFYEFSAARHFDNNDITYIKKIIKKSGHKIIGDYFLHQIMGTTTLKENDVNMVCLQFIVEKI